MRAVLSLCLALLVAAPAVHAQELSPVPDRRIAISRNVDFPGGDRASYFDTTLDACQQACLSDDQCGAFTFNQRSNSCFIKSGAGATAPYDGAISGTVFRTAPAILNAAPTRAAELSFLEEGDLAQARELAEMIGRYHSSDGFTAPQLLDTADARRAAGDELGAFRFVGAALSVEDRADLWLEYGRLGATLGTLDDAARATARERALPAVINAYLRAGEPALRATILIEMADMLEDADRGRAMIPALRLALATDPRRDAEAALERAQGLYGFRVAETEVESDSAAPRLCVVFNEDLVQAGVDYDPYVQLPDPAFTVEAEGRELCIDGVSHGERYRVVLREGLPAATGETLARNVELSLYVRDRSPAVRFTSRAYILPATGEPALPVETVNVGEIELALAHVSDRQIVRTMQEGLFRDPLYAWQEGYFREEIGTVVWEGSAEVGQELNRDILTRLPMTEALEGQEPGLYVLTAAIPDADPYDVPPATQWFILSDLGIATWEGSDGLTVALRSLADASALEGAEVQLISEGNAVLGTATTDADGVARFAAGLTRGTGAAQPALVTASLGDDMAFLSLTDPAFDLSDRGVEGREPAGPIDVFLTTDRGAYRAGETVYFTALMRDPTVAAVEGVPLTAILYRPDGVEYSRHASLDDAAGGHVFAMPVAANAPRGTWRIEVKADVDAEPLATDSVLVEDFLPERIDFDLASAGPLTLGQPATLGIEARYLFGPPAADLPVEGELVLSATDEVEGWPGYAFGRYDEPFRTRIEPFQTSAVTGPDGTVTLPLDLPQAEDAAQPLQATFVTRLSEGSGRPVERRLTAPVAPALPVIGMKPLFEDVAPEGSEARFALIGLGPDLAPQPMQVEWSVNRIDRRYQWYQVGGSWNWEPVTRRERVASGTETLGAQPVEVSAPVEWGHYELVVERVGNPYAAASTEFWAGWYGAADAGDSPDFLELSLDAEDYAVGDTARLRLVPREPGLAVISVLSDRVIGLRTVEVPAGETVIELPVTEEWGAGAYVTASVIRPMDLGESRNPSRALGLAYAPVAPGERDLDVAVSVVGEAAPRAPLEVAVQVEGVAPGETAYVTLAAVDVGILNLTGFEAPDPEGHYFGQRRLGVELRDVYGRLIDGMTGAQGIVRTGGDAGGQMRMEAPPPTEELVAYFTGPVEVGADGTAQATFRMPAFNGTVRLMAVAWSPRGVGSASQDVVVRDPVVVTASVPRFLTPGDESRLLLEIVHTEGPTGGFGLDLSADGVTLDQASVPGAVQIAEGAKTALRIPLTAGEPGLATIEIALTDPDGARYVKELTIPVQYQDPEISRTSRLTLGPDQTFTFDDQVFAGLREGSGTATLSVGPLARFDAPGLLATLDRYPYGCTEQLTSRALPLLYVNDVAEALGLGTEAELEERIDRAILAILANQSANGAFGMWGPSSGDLWLDAYVTDFLSRARARGHDVPETAFASAIDNLRNQVNYAGDFETGGEDIAYALLVLAREGAAAVGDLRYYVDERSQAFTTPLGSAQLGAALATYGDQLRADAMFRQAQGMLLNAPPEPDVSIWRADYGTQRRDAAAVLALAVEVGSDAVNREALAARLPVAGGPVSTQEAVWQLMAANALVDDMRATGVLVNGAPPAGLLVRLRQDGEGADPLLVANTDDGIELTVTTFGVPAEPEPAGGNGYAITREYYTLEGAPASPESVAAGARLVVVLTVQPFGRQEARLMVTDPLPAGFEIDNPNLLRGGDIRAMDWLDPVRGETAEFRQDRFLGAVNWRSDEPFRLAYIVRAVTPGTYHHAAASVEDMYRPQMRARTESGTVTVTQ
ncbi:alpha-2-macroglobulin family protein [Wenxinia marina]|uniref:Large extracellular alpha-helical protein n=1 Tax=Wenxinia marina DSM 24838 TaxID=1123501 RepID=A0A0D0QEL7_9RHOB|nr:alpha-2-macroglobulin family protein [Wenxinia marina]KIQ70777.1 Large extracellular alpha-helical protein [Wenxinia marina DSM 24838]GGL80235.1 hypothetical protein GCM10011392_38520 [Wenxinia marina]